MKPKKAIKIATTITLISLLILCFILDFFLFSDNKLTSSFIQLLEIILGSAISTSITYNIVTNNKTNINSDLKSSIKGSNNIVINNTTVTLGEINSFYNNIPERGNNNMKKIIELTKDLAKDNEVNYPLDIEFATRFIFDGFKISDSNLQEIWARLCVTELRQSGTISKRTLEIVKNMYSIEAKLFEKITKFTTNRGMLFKFIDKFTFEEISKLQDMGLIKYYQTLDFILNIKAHNEAHMTEKNILLIFKNKSDEDISLKIPCLALTSEGLEIKKALNIEMPEDVFLDLCKQIKTNYASPNLIITAHKVIGKLDNGYKHEKKDLLS